MDRLKKLVEQATAGPWKVAYWPVPQPYWWVGQKNSDPLSSKMGPPVTSFLSRETDARLISLAPTLAERYIEAIDALRDLHAEVEMVESVGVCLADRTPSLRAAEVVAAADALDTEIKETKSDEPA